MSHTLTVDFQHPANTGILAYLGKSGELRTLPNGSPQDHPNPYYELGTHPDLVARLWDELPVLLPRKCQWIINEHPVLVHPSSGIIFGFAGGTHTYALRLPPTVYEKALQSDAKRVHVYPNDLFDLDTVGKEWVFGGWFRGEEDWCLSAYEFAGVGIHERNAQLASGQPAISQGRQKRHDSRQRRDHDRSKRSKDDDK